MQVLRQISILCAVVLALVLADVPTSLTNFFGSDTTLKEPPCKCFPGDACWPSIAEWQSFNHSLGGKLVATVPIGSVCHDSTFGAYDAAKCEALRAAWLIPLTHDSTSSSMMSSFFVNRSCDAFGERSDPCVVGAHVAYAVNATTAEDYRQTLRCARERNIRLVIRNTGHDYFGRSTGPGALALWTHHNKEIKVIDYDSHWYRGKALRVGAGVQGFEAHAVANAAGLVVVTGTCPSVGIAGGFTQGAGLSPLSALHGMSADNVLEWEVVTASGKHLTATPDKHSDLYWALSGGGGGTYAAVLSMTVRAHPDSPVTATNMTFSYAIDGEDEEVSKSKRKFYEAITVFLSSLPDLVDTGASVVFLVMGNTFTMTPVVAPNQSVEQVNALLKPTTDKLRALGIPFASHSETFPSFLDAANAMIPDPGVSDSNLGGRIIPRSAVTSSTSVVQLAEAIEYIVDCGNLLFGVTLEVARFANTAPPNAVLPAWRDAIFDAVFGSPTNMTSIEANLPAQERIVNDFESKLEALTPGGGAYLNEAPLRLPHWKEAFFGRNYDRLAAIKQRYDPAGVFYGTATVGSEKWTEQDDGRLCQA
ncbi:putative FAD-linked oxidoreductase-like protein 12 [Podospora aff. communis PSN243]|uniref:FAD-linked oxidoreductase-like protein 12 n=1 Tax=Podospora aff. communis PSN243 TaxID=3040156 RepID=A0AAV9G456_9PEZI|nr:putative FAD-linked oxidoreductase-like protein 12 [Podospora aff. communis PSN243]